MKTLIVACGSLKDELKALLENHQGRCDLIFLEPELHMRANLLEKEIGAALEANSSKYGKTAVIYGKCSNNIDEICAKYGALRSPGEHCYEMFAGEKYFQYLEKSPGTYFLTDFLCTNFERLVVKNLGLDRYPELKECIFGNYRQLVYLDTMGRRMDEEAKKIADYLNVELFIERCGIESMGKRVLGAINGEAPSAGNELVYKRLDTFCK